MTDEAQQKHEAAVMLGRLGGRAGRGESKRRPLSTERAKAMAAARKAKMWNPDQYMIDAGWSLECIEATSKHGVSIVDAEGLTANQVTALHDRCKERLTEIHAAAAKQLKKAKNENK